jgi:hypothetical protein
MTREPLVTVSVRIPRSLADRLAAFDAAVVVTAALRAELPWRELTRDLLRDQTTLDSLLRDLDRLTASLDAPIDEPHPAPRPPRRSPTTPSR